MAVCIDGADDVLNFLQQCHAQQARDNRGGMPLRHKGRLVCLCCQQCSHYAVSTQYVHGQLLWPQLLTNMHEHKLVGLPTQCTYVLLIEKRATEAVLVVLVTVALSATCGINDMVSGDAWIACTPAVIIVHCPAASCTPVTDKTYICTESLPSNTTQTYTHTHGILGLHRTQYKDMNEQLRNKFRHAQM
jgi:hypothetical protein